MDLEGYGAFFFHRAASRRPGIIMNGTRYTGSSLFNQFFFFFLPLFLPTLFPPISRVRGLMLIVELVHHGRRGTTFLFPPPPRLLSCVSRIRRPSTQIRAGSAVDLGADEIHFSLSWPSRIGCDRPKSAVIGGGAAGLSDGFFLFPFSPFLPYSFGFRGDGFVFDMAEGARRHYGQTGELLHAPRSSTDQIELFFFFFSPFSHLPPPLLSSR